ncbi:MAG TPA: ROK family protein [Micromonosporaceae bacterium]|nr:ROK family protein [Micromonosporaceae bacterium]
MPTTSSPTAGHLLQLIREGKARTRKELGTVTGLARSTVAQRVDQLVSLGYLREAGAGASSGGRPPTALTFDESSRVVLVADLGVTHGRIAVTDLARRSLAEMTEEMRIDRGPEALLDFVADAFQRLLAEAGRRADEACGIGIGVPGPVDFSTGRVIQPPIMPGWHDFPIRDYLLGAFPAVGDVPVLVDNDANIMALGEWATYWRTSPALLFVKAGTGIGAGIVIGGQVYRGIDGAAGEIGHVRVPGFDAPCACGAAGCLAVAASGSALARSLTSDSAPVPDSRAVAALVQAGDAAAVAATRDAGRRLGEVLATVISLLNPEVVVIGGDLAHTHQHFITGVRSALYERLLPRSTRRLHLDIGRTGERAGVIGAAALVVDHVFSPEAVDARLAEAAA